MSFASCVIGRLQNCRHFKLEAEGVEVDSISASDHDGGATDDDTSPVGRVVPHAGGGPAANQYSG